MNRELIERFRQARNDQSLAVLEGFHAVKHAIRFEAELLDVAAVDRDGLEALTVRLAPDLSSQILKLPVFVPAAVFEQLSPAPPASGIIAIARRRSFELSQLLESPRTAPIVLLEEPRNLGNLGAVVRVAAAAGAAGVITIGTQDPWHPQVMRGAAGLHYAVPVMRVDRLPASDRPLVAIDPGGEPLERFQLPQRAILAFGTERHGVSQSLLRRADSRVAIPMQPGVSSLNLATAVAVMLYRWWLGGDRR